MSFLSRAIYFLFILLSSIGVFADNNSIQNPNLEKAERFFLKSEFDSSLKYLNLANFHLNSNDQDSLGTLIANRKARIFLIKEQNDSAFLVLKSNTQIIRSKFGERNEQLAICLDLLGDYYMALSDAEAALSNYRQSLKIRESIYNGNHPRIAYSFANIARFYNFKIEMDSAMLFAEKAYRIFSKSPEVNNDIPYENIITEYAYAVKIYYLNSSKDKSENLKAVRALCNEAMKFVNTKYGPGSWASASIYRSIGNTYTDILLGFQGSEKLKSFYFKQALQNYDKSILVISNNLGSDSRSFATLYYVKGLLYEYSFLRDSSEKCFYFYDKSIKPLVSSYQFNNIISEIELKNCTAKYELMTSLFTKSFCYWKVFNYTNDVRYLKNAYAVGRNMIPLWHYIIAEFESPFTNRLIVIYNQNIFNFLVDMAWKMNEIEPGNKYLNDIFYYSEQSKGSLQNRLLLDVVSHVGNSAILKISPADIQKALLNHETAFIEFFDTTMVIGISKDHFLVKKINENINQDSLFKVYQKILHINNPKMYETTVHLIYQTFFEPILSNLSKDIKYLVIASDGMISKIAVSGLVTDTTGNGNDFRLLNYVGQKYAIRHVLSGNDLLKNIRINKEEPGTLIGFAPSFRTNSTLPFSKLLIQNLQEKIEGDYYLDEDGSKYNFIGHAPNHRVIQLSTHAEADLGEMMRSKILFTDKYEKSNFITLDSIYKIKFNTQLAILSACETNVGRMEYGEGSLNFARAFLYAGCNSTLTTQWKVDDKTTSAILMEFYTHLLNEHFLSEALQKAQITYIENCKSSTEANPFFWSSLVITGSDEPVYLVKKSNSLTYGVVGFSALMIFVGLYKNRRKREQAPKV